MWLNFRFWPVSGPLSNAQSAWDLLWQKVAHLSLFNIKQPQQLRR
jgi:hypothetical protein